MAKVTSKPADDHAIDADGRPELPRGDPWSGAHRGFQGSGSISSAEMSETGLTVPDMNEPLSRYNITVTVGCDGGYLPGPAAFAAAADQAAWGRGLQASAGPVSRSDAPAPAGHDDRP
jgi:hypothetical protein